MLALVSIDKLRKPRADQILGRSSEHFGHAPIDEGGAAVGIEQADAFVGSVHDLAYAGVFHVERRNLALQTEDTTDSHAGPLPRRGLCNESIKLWARRRRELRVYTMDKDAPGSATGATSADRRLDATKGGLLPIVDHRLGEQPAARIVRILLEP